MKVLVFLQKIYKKICKIKEEKEFSVKEKNIRDFYKHTKIKVMTIDETLDELCRGKSICRFGDGEMNIIIGGKIGFQGYDEDLAKRLKEILSACQEECLIGVPDALNTIENLTSESRHFWVSYLNDNLSHWIEVLDEKCYANANMSRCYIRYDNKEKSGEWFAKLKSIWNDKDVVIIEGEMTKLGCGNDFLDNANSIRRIICPAEHAFSKYAQIYDFISNNIDKQAIIILALGPAATVLAYDLALQGYQALDLGHCDIEYSWYKMGTKEKVAVKGKYTNEVKGGNIADNSLNNQIYLEQIITNIV